MYKHDQTRPQAEYWPKGSERSRRPCEGIHEFISQPITGTKKTYINILLLRSERDRLLPLLVSFFLV